MDQYNNSPDKLQLTKAQVLVLIDEFIDEMGQNKKENWSYMLEAWAIRKIFNRVPVDKFPWFWQRFWEKAERFRYMNTAVNDLGLQNLGKLTAQINKQAPLHDLDFSIEKVLNSGK